jgi:acyl-homoserine-lactone acylase
MLGTGISASAAPPVNTGSHGCLADIRRTEYGIPHILAHDFGSLGYGYGYAFAQDDFCMLAQRVLAIRGERSEYFGATADSGDPLDPATNLASDAYFTELRQSGVVRKLVAQPAPLGPTTQVRQLVDGYVAGFNTYLADTGSAG